MEPSIQIGVDSKTGEPISVPLSVLERHTHILGQSGGFKTILMTAIALLLMAADKGASFFFADAGGDLYCLNRIRQLALKLGMLCHFISLADDDSDWSSLDVMAAVTPLTYRTIPRATSYFTTSLSLDAGFGYGRSYHSLQNWKDFADAFSEFLAEGNCSPAYSQVIAKLRKKGEKRRTSDMTEAQLAAEALLYYPQLEPSEFPDRQLDVAQIIEQGGVGYGFLPTLMEPGSRSVLALLVWSCVLEAMRRYSAGLPKRRIYIFIDEWASLCSGRAFSDLITLCRKFGIRLILVNQTNDQLEGIEKDLRRIVWCNTALKLYMSPAAGADLEFMQELSPDVIKKRGVSQSHRGLQSSTSTNQQLGPELEKNEGLEIAFSRFEGLVSINDGTYKPPVRFTFVPDCTKDEHEKLSNTPLPKRPGITPLSTNGSYTPLAEKQEAIQARQEALEALLKTLQAEEEWQDQGKQPPK